MNSKRFLIVIPGQTETLQLLFVVSLILPVLLAACSPLEETETAPDGSSPTIETSETTVLENPQSPTSDPEETKFSPSYLPLTTKLDIPPQIIDGVTAQIDWAYVDESRVSFQYTLSGLPAETTFDSMQVRIRSAAIPDAAYNGAGGWNSTPLEQGTITGTTDLFLLDGAFNAEEHPNVDLGVDIPADDRTFHFEFTVPALHGIRIEHVDQTVTANDVSMTLKTLVLNPSYAEALICFQMPSAADWGLTASKMTVDDKDYPFAGGGLMPGTDGKDFSLNDPERCITAGFNILHDGSAASVTLTVPWLMGSVPEVVEQERVDRANQRLAGACIEFVYLTFDHGAKVEITRRPEGMPDEEIYPLIWEALSEQYEGPWVFTVAVER